MNFLTRLVPFLMLGIAVVAFAFGLLLFAYLLIAGAIVGLILFGISLIREKFFPKKELTRYKEKKGRTFDHEEK